MHKGLGKHAFQGLISCSIFGGSVLAIGFVYLFFSGRIFGGVIAVEEIWRLFVFARLLGPLSWMPIQIFIKSIL